MTLQEAIKSGNHNEIAKINRQMDEIHRKDLKQKLLVIKAYLICKVIVVIGIGLILIKHFS